MALVTRNRIRELFRLMLAYCLIYLFPSPRFIFRMGHLLSLSNNSLHVDQDILRSNIVSDSSLSCELSYRNIRIGSHRLANRIGSFALLPFRLCMIIFALSVGEDPR